MAISCGDNIHSVSTFQRAWDTQAMGKVLGMSSELHLLDETQLKEIAEAALIETAKRKNMQYGIISIIVKVQDGKPVHAEHETKEIGRF